MAAPPPRPEEDESPSIREQKIEARIKYWLELIRTAKDGKTIDQGRRGLIGDYREAQAGGFVSSFSLLMVKPVTTFLTGQLKDTDPLKRLKEINTALAISQMSQKAMQPVLEVMVKHSNPAVRYSGWRSYYKIRNLVLKDPDGTKVMFKSLAAAGDETSLAVLALMQRMLSFPPVRPLSVSPEAWKQAHKAAYAVVDPVAWRTRRCKRVLDGDTEMAHVFSNALWGLVRLDAALGKDDKKKRQRLRQMIADLTWCAGRAYDKALEDAAEADEDEKANRAAAGVIAGGAGGATTAPASMPAAAAGKLAAAEDAALRTKAHRQDATSLAVVLRVCERNLNALAGMDRLRAHIENALKSKKDPGGDVRRAVLKWMIVLKIDGVVTPRKNMFDPKPTTKPASKPASIPTTKAATGTIPTE